MKPDIRSLSVSAHKKVGVLGGKGWKMSLKVVYSLTLGMRFKSPCFIRPSKIEID